MTIQNKLDISSTLEIGKSVEDCRGRTLPIKVILPQISQQLPLWALTFITYQFWDYLPNKLNYLTEDILLIIFGTDKLVDYDLILEDDSSCSWMHCCSLPNK